MKTLIFIILLTGIEIYSQGLFTITTDKSEYVYGESFEISLSYINNTDSIVLFRPECGRSMWIEVKEFEFIEYHIMADGCEKDFAPNEGEIWKFKIDPDKHGFPVNDGLQTVYGFGFNFKDSIKFTASKYYGGTIRVYFSNEEQKLIRDELFNSIDATVVNEFETGNPDYGDEVWSIKGVSIDSLITAHLSQYETQLIIERFPFIEPEEIIVTDLNIAEVVVYKYSLSQNYPNPFNPSTQIKYSVPKSTLVQIKVYNLLGQEIATLVNEEKLMGNYEVTFNGNHLSSGVYFYQMKADNFHQTKKLLLMR